VQSEQAHAVAGTSLEEVAELLDVEHIAEHLYTRGQPDPDLVIRTSGEQRLGGFLLWQSAHSEFYFVEALGPDLREVDFGLWEGLTFAVVEGSRIGRDVELGRQGGLLDVLAADLLTSRQLVRLPVVDVGGRRHPLPMRVRPTLFLLALLVAPIAGSERAQATFPGGNGLIAFVRNQDGIYTISPDGSGQRRIADGDAVA